MIYMIIEVHRSSSRQRIFNKLERFIQDEVFWYIEVWYISNRNHW